MILKNVILILDLKVHLLSVSSALYEGFTIFGDASECRFRRDEKLSKKAERRETTFLRKTTRRKTSSFTSSTKNPEPGVLVNMDLCGPMDVESIGGLKYFLLIKGDYSHCKTV
ncbi:hypothetical protein JTB14_016648 [Gonioctena quinquepunctata]|nr:hypothetical protein JTB14_016648 [Gonioctena quinquepunctata]